MTCLLGSKIAPSQQGSLVRGRGRGQTPVKQGILALTPSQVKGDHYTSSRMSSRSRWEAKSHCLFQQGLTLVSPPGIEVPSPLEKQKEATAAQSPQKPGQD